MDAVPPQDQFRQRAELALTASSRTEIESFCAESVQEVLMALAHNPHLKEPDLLRLLHRTDLPAEVVREMAQHRLVRRSYAVQLALVRHPKAPRLVTLSLMKFLYVFDLLRVAHTPAVPADVKKVAEEAILKRLAGMPRGERISLARQGTARVAAGLVFTQDPVLIRAALDNAYLTEAELLKVLAREDLPDAVVAELSQHPRWSHSYYLRLALIRNPLTPLARVLEFLPEMAVTDLRDICLDHRMPPQVRKYIEAHCTARLNQRRRGGQEKG